MHSRVYRLQACCLLISCLSIALLAACGYSDTLAPLTEQETATSTVATTLTPIIDETATLAAALATEDALYPRSPSDLTAIAAPENQTAIAAKATQIQANIDSDATAFARPSPAITRAPPIYPTRTPEPTLMGIYTQECAEWFAIDGVEFAVGNCWYGRFANVSVTLDAGVEAWVNTPSLRGAIVVFTETLDLATPEPGARDTRPPAFEYLYWTPVEAGRVTILSVNNEHVTLEATNGTRFYFNLLTRVWEDANGVPLPTPTVSPSTPTPTP